MVFYLFHSFLSQNLTSSDNRDTFWSYDSDGSFEVEQNGNWLLVNKQVLDYTVTKLKKLDDLGSQLQKWAKQVFWIRFRDRIRES